MNVAMLLDIPASITPDTTILLSEGQSLSFADLRELGAHWATVLHARGVQRGDRVGVFTTNRLATIGLVFGAASVGAVLVPMNNRSKSGELEHLLADSDPAIVVTEARYLEVVTASCSDRCPILNIDDAAEADSTDDWNVTSTDASDLFALLYTSGTTSLPKGVPISHAQLSGYVIDRADVADGSPRGRTLLSAPLYHIAGLTALLNAVYAGRTVVVQSQFEPGEWLRLVDSNRITHVFCVPTMLSQIIKHPSMRSADLSSLEVISYGAAPMPHSLLLSCMEAFPRADFVGAYGLTETTSTVAVLAPEDHRLVGSPEEIAKKRERLRSVGRPVSDVEIRVVSDQGVPLEPGEHGAVEIRSRRNSASYWSGTVERRSGAEQWMPTGDLGHLDEDGYLFLTARVGDLIIRGGENVSPTEVEDVLLTHPSVIDACVVGIQDPEWGERIGAAVVLVPDSDVPPSVILDHVRDRLPAFKRPETLVVVDDLPRTSTGKLRRGPVRDMIRERGQAN